MNASHGLKKWCFPDSSQSVPSAKLLYKGRVQDGILAAETLSTYDEVHEIYVQLH